MPFAETTVPERHNNALRLSNDMTQPPCSYCKVINKICFWGPRPEAMWKRPALLLFSVLLVVGFGVLAWWLVQRPDNGLIVILSSLLSLVGALGVAVSMRGCNACVARLFGEV